ncbi:MAG TPA: hypothetical protein VLB11_10075 [Methyloceanibacter sp.]|nr:hypothetical protein [Methyloceanibacter sp.]
MFRIVLATLGTVAVLALGLEASAGAKKCPDGYYYDEDSGKCIKRRGSY